MTKGICQVCAQTITYDGRTHRCPSAPNLQSTPMRELIRRSDELQHKAKLFADGLRKEHQRIVEKISQEIANDTIYPARYNMLDERRERLEELLALWD